MTQIIIDVDSITLKALERSASKSHTPVPQWIMKLVRKGLKKEWPEDYFSVFGAMEEDDLLEPPEIPFKYDAKRESL